MTRAAMTPAEARTITLDFSRQGTDVALAHAPRRSGVGDVVRRQDDLAAESATASCSYFKNLYCSPKYGILKWTMDEVCVEFLKYNKPYQFDQVFYLNFRMLYCLWFLEQEVWTSP